MQATKNNPIVAIPARRMLASLVVVAEVVEAEVEAVAFTDRLLILLADDEALTDATEAALAAELAAALRVDNVAKSLLREFDASDADDTDAIAEEMELAAEATDDEVVTLTMRLGSRAAAQAAFSVRCCCLA